MMQRIGTCSLCGGDVMGHSGAWWGTVPPPGPTCASCGAVVAADVIQMTRPATQHAQRTEWTWSSSRKSFIPTDWTPEDLGL